MGAVIARPPLPSGPFLVVGLARSGVAAALALRKRGREVLGTDARAGDAGVRERLPGGGERGREVLETDARAVDAGVRERLAAAGVTVRDGEAGVDLLGGIEAVVKSPG